MQNLYARPPVPLPGWVSLRSDTNYRSPKDILDTLNRILPLEHPVEAGSPLTGSRRATGRPRSTISTGEPPCTPSIKALRLFLASVILAFFIMAIIAISQCLFKLLQTGGGVSLPRSEKIMPACARYGTLSRFASTRSTSLRTRSRASGRSRPRANSWS